MTYGINGTLATRLPGSTTIGVKGAWTEITDATDIPTHLLMLWLSQVWITGFNLYRIDVATGPIGDEEIIVPDLQASTDGAIAQWYYSGPWNVDFPIGIPTGTRIIARVACDTTASAGQRDHSLAATIVTFASVLVARTGELRLGGVHTTSLDRLISWPDTLPIPLITPYDEQIAEVALRTPMEVGPAKVRRRFTKSWRVFKVAFDLDQEQRDTMIDFFVNRCRDGELSFAWPNPEWADPDAASLTFRFIPPLRMAEMGVGGLWRATVGLEIPPEP
jgi:hypothetical protein